MNEIIHVQTRLDLIRMLPKDSTIAEIGVHKGYFSNDILSLPHLKHVFLIDSWKPRPEYNDPLSFDDHEANLEETRRSISGHNQGLRFTIIRADSLDAAKGFKDGSLTATFIDADHSYDACLADLVAWSRVVGPNGFLMGHDHVENQQAKKWGFGVVPAVRDFCCEFGWRITALDQEEFQSFCLRKI